MNWNNISQNYTLDPRKYHDLDHKILSINEELEISYLSFKNSSKREKEVNIMF
jgi:hypothetical protein